jgi:hypothetical protein
MSYHKYIAVGPIIELKSKTRFNRWNFEKKYNLEGDTFHELNRENIENLPDDTYLLLENKYRPSDAPAAVRLNEDCGDFREILPDNMEASLNWFKQYFADDIESLEQEFGKENIRIYFGVVLYMG